MPRFCGGPVHTVKREYMKKVSALVAALVVALAAASFFATPYHGKVVTNPDWHEPYRNDTALVFLDKPVKNIKPAAIAPRGYLDALKANGTIDDYAYLNVGYGSAEQLVVPQTGPTFPFDGIRKYTYSTYSTLDPEYIHRNQDVHQGTRAPATATRAARHSSTPAPARTSSRSSRPATTRATQRVSTSASTRPTRTTSSTRTSR
jgi:hypothetical protein